MKKISNIHIGAFFILLFFITFLIKNNTQKHIITLTDSGFNPSKIIINKGDSITFVNKTDRPFWPASDLHPSHTAYSDFDPKKPIDSGNSWSFRFEKSGNWSFHDHLASLNVGTVLVLDNSNKIQSEIESQNLDDCGTSSNNGGETSCWKSSLENTLRTKGISATFDLYSKYYEEEPVFAQDCHGYTHIIGEGAYELYKNNKDFDVNSKVSYCSYGFFHGFIEAMFQDLGNLDKARDFCDYIDNKLKGQTSALGACMHGIGHGVTDGSDPRAFGDVKALISPGLKLCQKVGRDDYERQICGTGVFNSLEGMYLDSKYKIKLNYDDPFWICKEQDTDYFKKSCYDDFKDIIMVISNQDFAKAAKFVEGIKEDYFAQGAIDNLATYNAYSILRKPDYNFAIDICHNLQKRLHVDCISGLGAGFMTAGVPGKEYEKALELCESKRITKEERAGCFRRVLHASFIQYPLAVHKKVCSMVDKSDKLGLNSCNF